MTIHFKDYSLSEPILKALDLLHFKAPTKVQQEIIPLAMENKDVIVKSQTGSGKTAAFAIPICENINWEENKPQALILTPTRELAMQVGEDCFNIGRFKRIKVVNLYGKAPFHIQQKQLKQKTHIVVGTPGRIADHLEQGTFITDEIRYLVIDEADEMLRMGFIDQVENIIKALPKKRRTMLFSATMKPHIESICKKYMIDPITVEIESTYITADKVKQVCYKTTNDDKLKALRDLTIVENPESCMIFCNRKEGVDTVREYLKGLNYSCTKIHGGMEQRDRFAVMEDFRNGKFRYLVATDVAARGIDIDHVTHVINFDVPEDLENYVHRIGRTGRGGKSGKALMLVTPREERGLKALEAYIEHNIACEMLPTKNAVEEAKSHFKEKMATPMQKVKTKGEKLSEEIMKLHINAGKKTKMRPVDIVGTLCNLPGMSADDVGIIQVQDISTFVEILNHKGEEVYKRLQTTPIKGRIRRVSKTDR